jgi:transcriptional regulator with XRE-family HTH domain
MRRFNPIIPAEDFLEYRRFLGLSQDECAAMLGVTLRTIRNYEKGRVRVPYSAFFVLRTLSGQLPYEFWQGWVCRGPTLISPAGETFEVGELSWLTLTFAMAREWKKQRTLSASQTVDHRDGQSTPAPQGGPTGDPMSAGVAAQRPSRQALGGEAEPGEAQRLPSPAGRLTDCQRGAAALASPDLG